MTHTAHIDIHEHGLADNCPACAEHAAAPWIALDKAALIDLVDRTLRNRFGTVPRWDSGNAALSETEQRTNNPFGFYVDARSDCEAVAMARIMNQLERTGALFAAAPTLVNAYLCVRWNIA